MEHYEFLKLEENDREILVWLIDHVQSNAIKSWLCFIGEDYKRRCIEIDIELVMKEIQDI